MVVRMKSGKKVVAIAKTRSGGVGCLKRVVRPQSTGRASSGSYLTLGNDAPISGSSRYDFDDYCHEYSATVQLCNRA